MDCWISEAEHGKTKGFARLSAIFALTLLMVGTASPGTAGEELLDEIVPAGFPVVLRATTEPVTDESAMQFDPTISGDIVVLTELRNGGQNIAYVDLTTGEYVWVTQGQSSKRLADVDGNRIVYTDFTTGLAAVVVYEIDTAQEKILVIDGRNDQQRPRIDGDLVVYEHRNAEARFVWVTNIATGAVTEVTDGTYQDMRPVVSGNWVAFERREETRNVFLHDLDTGNQWAVAPHAGDRQEKPHIDGELLIFDAIPRGETKRDLFLHNLATGDTVRLDLPGDQTRGRISGGFVSFDQGQGQAWDVGLWHIPTCNVHRVTDSDNADFLNDIDANRMVSTSDRSGSFDIWLYEFEPLPGLDFLGQGDPSLCPLVDDRFKEV